MPDLPKRLSLLLFATVAVTASPIALAQTERKAVVSFRRDVAPILWRRCLACHGERRSEGGFRLDSFAQLMKPGEFTVAVTPRDVDESELLRRIAAKDDQERMPLDSKPLDVDQIATVKRWIEQGAVFDGDDKSMHLKELSPPRTFPKPPEKYRAPVPVLSLAWRPGRDELAVAGYHEVTVWNPQGRLVRRLAGVGQRVTGLAFDAGGERLVVGSGVPGDYGELRILNADSGATERVVGHSLDIVSDIALSADGKLVAMGSADRTLRVFRTDTGERTMMAKQHADWITSVAFNKAGNLITSASRDSTVKTFRPTTGEPVATYLGHKGSDVNAVAFDPVSNRAVTGGKTDRLHIWDPLVIAANDGTAALVEARFRKDLIAQHIPQTEEALVIDVDAGQIFCGDVGGRIRHYDLESRKLVREYRMDDWVYSVDYDDARKRLAAGAYHGEVRIWNTDDGSLVTSFLAAPAYSK